MSATQAYGGSTAGPGGPDGPSVPGFRDGRAEGFLERVDDPSRLEALLEAAREGAELAEYKAWRTQVYLRGSVREARDDLDLDRERPVETAASISGSIMQVARGVMIAVVSLIVLGELYATDIVANPTNPNAWTNMTSTFANYGTTAYTMIGLGLIALGASTALAFFGAFTSGGGGR